VRAHNFSQPFLVDSGSVVSVVPRSWFNSGFYSEHVKLYAANGSPIKTFGKKRLALFLGNNKFTWDFIIADIPRPILGADFLGNFGLLIDCKNHTLIHKNTTLYGDKVPSICCISKSHINQISFAPKSKITTFHNSQILYLPSKSFCFNNSRNEFKIKTLADLGPIISPNDETDYTKNLVYTIESKSSDPFEEIMDKINIDQYTPSCKVNPPQHHIYTEGLPTHAKVRQLAPEKLSAAKEIFDELLANDTVRPSSSNWSSALLMKLKKDGSWRCCGDYRQLNAITIKDEYPLPLIRDVTTRLGLSKIFSKIDLEKAYHQLTVAPEDVCKTAIITPFGLFEYLKMPFGLKNAAASFQRHMDNLFTNVSCTVVYLDDILVGSKNEMEHKKDLETVFRILASNGLRINKAKCEFNKASIVFLGHVISYDLIAPIREKINAISILPPPITVRDVRRFCGMINFYHQFIPHCSELLSPLTELTKNKSKLQKICWSSNLEETYDCIKRKLTEITSLSIIRNDSELILTTDASNIAIGATLGQIIENVQHPVSFFSQKLNTTEIRYSTFDRELLGIYRAVKHFIHFLEHRSFTIYTDHKPLVYALTLKDPSPRQLHQTCFLSQFDCKIRYIPGNTNIVADCLSRPFINSIECFNFLDIDSLRNNQNEAVKECQQTSLKLVKINDIWFDKTHSDLLRPIIPQEWRAICIKAFHEIGHYGYKSTFQLMHLQLVWYKMRKDIKNYVSNCIRCNKNKVSRGTKLTSVKFDELDKLEHLHIDITGPLPPNKGYRFLLCLIDRATSWFEVVPLKSITANDVCDSTESTWFYRYGPPKRITTDQGRQFESVQFKSLCNKYNIKKIRTTPYHPQGNGKVEIFNRFLKETLRTKCNNTNWLNFLEETCLALRLKPNNATSISPYEKLTGKKYIFQIFKKTNLFNLKENDSKGYKTCFIKNQTARNFDDRYGGPFPVVSLKRNNVTVEINDDNKVLNLKNVKLR